MEQTRQRGGGAFSLARLRLESEHGWFTVLGRKDQQPSPQPAPDGPSDASRKTFRLDTLRAPFAGVLLVAWNTFALVVANRVFDATDGQKTLIAMAAAIGLFLTPFTNFLFGKLGWLPSRAASLIAALLGLMMSLAALAPSLEFFMVFGITGTILSSQLAMLMVDIYTQNYLPQNRARRMSPHVVIGFVTSGIAGLLGGFLLDFDVGFWRWIYAASALSGLACSKLFAEMPAQPMMPPKTPNPFANVGHAFSDRIFGITLLAWMLMGLGNLLTVPLRVELLANQEYGFNARNFEVTLVTTLIPNVMQVSTAFLWAFLFDRLHFMVYRLFVNAFILGSLFVFFSANSLLGLGIGNALQGIAMGGGVFAWNLWVTKLAPEGKAGAYMSVHTNFTGIRALVAPALGFFLLANFGPAGVMWVAGPLMIVSTLIFVSLIRHPRFRAA